MTHAYGGNLKIYMYIITDTAEIIVFPCTNEKKNKKKEKKYKRNEIYYRTVLHVIHVTKKISRVIKINYRRLTT